MCDGPGRSASLRTVGKGAFCPELSPDRLTVPADADGFRLDRFLGDALRSLGISREKLKEAIRNGAVTINGVAAVQPRLAVRAGDTVRLARAPAETPLEPEAGDLRVLHADEHIAVLDKAPGLTVHPCPSCPSGTLVHRLLGLFPDLARQGGPRPGIVHRLDKDTSGLIVAALTEKDRLLLARAFAEREVAKEYLALVRGVPCPASGEIKEPVGRDARHKTRMAVVPVNHGGREAHSAYRTLYADPAGLFSLLAVRLHTGRTHQIRVHMAFLGHPLWGDRLYAESSAPAEGEGRAGRRPKFPGNDAPRQMLHAWRLGLRHPASGQEMRFTAPPPEDFIAFALELSRRLTPVVLTGSPGCGKSSLLDLLARQGIPVWSADAVVRESYARGGDGALLLGRRFGGRFSAADGGVDTGALFAAMRDDGAVRREVEALVHPLVRHDLALFWRREQDNCLANGRELAVAEVPLYLEAGWRSGGQAGDRGEAVQIDDKPAVGGFVKARPLRRFTAAMNAACASRRAVAKADFVNSLNGEAVPAGTWPAILVGVYCPFRIRAARMREHRGWHEETIAVMESWQWPQEKKMRGCGLIIDNSGDYPALEAGSRALLGVLRGLAAKRSRTMRRLFEELTNPATGDTR